MNQQVRIGHRIFRITLWTGVLSAILPGLGQFLSGKIQRGMVLIFLFLLFNIFMLENWNDVTAVFQSRAIDEWVAVGTLFLIIAGIWLFAVIEAALVKIKEESHGHSQWSIAWRQFKKNKLAIIGLICVVSFYIIALLAPLIAPYDPIAQENVVETRYLAPSFEHPLGTDKFGRDIFSRVVYGSRISLSIGFVAIAISISIGMLIGAVAGYFGGLVDGVLMRLVDVLLAFPRIFLVLALIAVYSNSLWLTMAVLGFTGWMGTSRIVRGQVLSIKEEGYILAARALGMSDSRVIFRHVLPNVLAPVIVIGTLGIGNTILAESFLSYLGLSVSPPTPTWGSIVFEGQDNLLGAWWISTFPGIAIVLTVLGYNLVGDGLRDALDPKIRDDR